MRPLFVFTARLLQKDLQNLHTHTFLHSKPDAASRLGLGRERSICIMLRAVTTTKSVASVGRSRIFRRATLHPLTSFDRCLCLGLGEEDPTRFMHKSMYPQRERVRASPLPPLCPASHVLRLYLLSAMRPMCSLLFPDAYVHSGDFPMTTLCRSCTLLPTLCMNEKCLETQRWSTATNSKTFATGQQSSQTTTWSC